MNFITNMAWKALVGSLLISWLILVGCPAMQSPTDEYGTLELTLSPAGMTAKDIVPPLDMDIEYFDVYGDGPGSAAFSRTGISGLKCVESSLIVGEWAVTVEVFNAAHTLIGTGSTVVTIVADKVAQSEVSIAPLQGSGSLNINISWPADTIGAPVVSGTLAATGETPQDISFTLGDNSTSYTGSDLDVSWYALAVQIYDDDYLVWECSEEVRILRDQTTDAIFNLTLEDLNYGTLVLMLSSVENATNTIVPPLDMDTEYYDVYGDGPEAAAYSQLGIPGPTLVENALIPGEWVITAEAFNADNILIRNGSVVVEIIAGETRTYELSVAPLEGTGTLAISVSWPEGLLTTPTVIGSVAADGESPQEISFTLGENSASSSTSSLEVGYYVLDLRLYDGEEMIWGLMEAVRILKDQISEGIINLTEDDLS